MGKGTNADLVQGNAAYDMVFAQADNKVATVKYTITTTKVENGKLKALTPLSKQIKITNGFTFPTVTVTSDRIERLDEAAVKDVLTTNVDMNAPDDKGLNDSVEACFINKFTQNSTSKLWEAIESTASEKEVTVNYAVVHEDGLYFACKAETRFTLS